MQFDGSQCEPMTWKDRKLLVHLICRQPHLVAMQARNMHLELRECFADLLICSNCCADLWHFVKIRSDIKNQCKMEGGGLFGSGASLFGSGSAVASSLQSKTDWKALWWLSQCPRFKLEQHEWGIMKGSSSGATLSFALRSNERVASPVAWLLRRLLYILGNPPWQGKTTKPRQKKLDDGWPESVEEHVTLL